MAVTHRLVVLAAGLTLLVAGAPAAAKPGYAPLNRATCDHGVQRSGPVRVCEDGTGVTGQEPMLVRNSRGTLFMGMAGNEGVVTQQGFLTGTAQSYLLRSRDDGRTWQRVRLPRGVNLSEGVPYVDAVTDRLWVTSTNLSVLPCGSPVVWSDDEGRTWRQAERRPSCQPLGVGDWPKLFTGPYKGGRKGRAVYVCNYLPAIWVALQIGCWRSDDAGRHFRFLGPLPVKSLVCRADSVRAKSFHTIVHGTGQVLDNGDVVIPVDLCGTIVAVRSTDHGETWRVSKAIGRAGSVANYLTGGGGSLAANIFMNMFFDQTLAQDDRGNLFLAWVRDGVRLAVSRDGGRTWRSLGRVSPRSVRGAFDVSVTARGRGEVALAWWGTGRLTDPLLGYGERYRGWMTYARDALARKPRFDSAPTSRAAAPPQITSTLGCCASTQMFIEYSGVTFTGPRDVRAAFVRFPKGATLPKLVLGRMKVRRR